MSGKNIAVFGVYPTHESADAAVDTLRTKGFRNTDISVLLPQNVGSKEFGHEKGTKSAEGAVVGGGTGAAIGGALGWLAGIGMLAIPGVGPFIAAGPITAALAGMGAGGAIGGTTGALIGLGIPEYQAKRYEGRMRKGGILLSVHADDHEWVRKGKQILEQTGAEDISSTGEAKGDFGNTDRPTPRAVHAAPVEVAPAAPAERAADNMKELAGATVTTTKGLSATTGEAITDTWITTKVSATFVDETVLKGSHINVDTDNYVVTLKGTVGSGAAKNRAAAIAGDTEGVTSVVNQLVVT